MHGCFPGFSGDNCEMSNETMSSTMSPTTDAVTTASLTTVAITTVIETTAAPSTVIETTAAETTIGLSTELISTSQVPLVCEPTNSCDGHYTCNNDTGEKICDAGYTGVDCKDRDIANPNDPECPSLGPCKFGGTCWNKTCCCLDGYEGILCQEEILECISFPCVNGATCKDEIGSYRCECLPGMYRVNMFYAIVEMDPFCLFLLFHNIMDTCLIHILIFLQITAMNVIFEVQGY